VISMLHDLDLQDVIDPCRSLRDCWPYSPSRPLIMWFLWCYAESRRCDFRGSVFTGGLLCMDQGSCGRGLLWCRVRVLLPSSNWEGPEAMSRRKWIHREVDFLRRSFSTCVKANVTLVRLQLDDPSHLTLACLEIQSSPFSVFKECDVNLSKHRKSSVASWTTQRIVFRLRFEVERHISKHELETITTTRWRQAAFQVGPLFWTRMMSDSLPALVVIAI
jgi:hypothetical protein